MAGHRRWIVNVITKAFDALTGKSLKDKADEVAKTAADLKDAVRKAREKIDAERNAEEAAAHKGKGG